MTRLSIKEIENRLFPRAHKEGNFHAKYNKTTSKKEEECRKILEDIFQQKFPSIRPTWLINPKSGQRLELDMYNQQLGIACEYNGEQHYKFNVHFHRTYEKFLEQLERDRFKREKCSSLGIKLIEVPYNVNNLNYFLRANIERIIAEMSNI